MIHFHGRWIFNKLKIVKLYLQTSVQLALLVFVFSCSHLSMRKLGCNFLVLYLWVLHSQLTLSLGYFSEDWYNSCSAIKLRSLFSLMRWDSWWSSKNRCLHKSSLCGYATISLNDLGQVILGLDPWLLCLKKEKKKKKTRLNLKLLSPLKCCAMFPYTWQNGYKANFWWAFRFPMSPQVPNRNFLTLPYPIKFRN